jgi:hypothetical protein
LQRWHTARRACRVEHAVVGTDGAGQRLPATVLSPSNRPPPAKETDRWRYGDYLGQPERRQPIILDLPGELQLPVTLDSLKLRVAVKLRTRAGVTPWLNLTLIVDEVTLP